MKAIVLIISTFLVVLIISCGSGPNYNIAVDEVAPWCILDFDAVERTPEQRIAMLKEMGIKRYGFNKGKGDLTSMIDEFNLAKENDIEITSIFLWLNPKRDSINKLSTSNQMLFRNLEQVEYKPTIWVSFSEHFFKDKTQEQSLNISIEMLKFVKQKADTLGCELAIYNHRGWFGNPYNQLEILKRLNDSSISIVYNFHHAHAYVDDFPLLVKKLKPHLSFVNLNGIKIDDLEIIPIGQGDFEYKMMKQLIDEGYNGPWGILGHIKTEDVKEVLKRNIQGLYNFNSLYSPE